MARLSTWIRDRYSGRMNHVRYCEFCSSTTCDSTESCPSYPEVVYSRPSRSYSRGSYPRMTPLCSYCNSHCGLGRDCPSRPPICNYCFRRCGLYDDCPAKGPICKYCHKRCGLKKRCPSRPPVCTYCKERCNKGELCDKAPRACALCGSYTCRGKCARKLRACARCGSYACKGECARKRHTCSLCGSYYCKGDCTLSACSLCGYYSCTGECAPKLRSCILCGYYSCTGECAPKLRSCSLCSSYYCKGDCTPCPRCQEYTCTDRRSCRKAPPVSGDRYRFSSGRSRSTSGRPRSSSFSGPKPAFSAEDHDGYTSDTGTRPSRWERESDQMPRMPPPPMPHAPPPPNPRRSSTLPTEGSPYMDGGAPICSARICCNQTSCPKHYDSNNGYFKLYDPDCPGKYYYSLRPAGSSPPRRSSMHHDSSTRRPSMHHDSSTRRPSVFRDDSPERSTPRGRPGAGSRRQSFAVVDSDSEDDEVPPMRPSRENTKGPRLRRSGKSRVFEQPARSPSPPARSYHTSSPQSSSPPRSSARSTASRFQLVDSSYPPNFTPKATWSMQPAEWKVVKANKNFKGARKSSDFAELRNVIAALEHLQTKTSMVTEPSKISAWIEDINGCVLKAQNVIAATAHHRGESWWDPHWAGAVFTLWSLVKRIIEKPAKCHTDGSLDAALELSNAVLKYHLEPANHVYCLA